jgi:hypothetical protein
MSFRPAAVVAMFSRYCSSPFEVEPVEVVDAMGASAIYPQLATRTMEVEVEYIKGCTGEQLLTILGSAHAFSAAEDV